MCQKICIKNIGFFADKTFSQDIPGGVRWWDEQGVSYTNVGSLSINECIFTPYLSQLFYWQQLSFSMMKSTFLVQHVELLKVEYRPLLCTVSRDMIDLFVYCLQVSIST